MFDKEQSDQECAHLLFQFDKKLAVACVGNLGSLEFVAESHFYEFSSGRGRIREFSRILMARLSVPIMQ